MLILRGVLVLVFLAAAVWLMVELPPDTSRDRGVHVLAAVCLALMATTLVLRPWRNAWGLLLCLALMPPFVALIVSARTEALKTLIATGVLLALGAVLAALLRPNVPRAAADVACESETDRARGMQALAYLIEEEHGPGLREAVALLRQARGSQHEDVRKRARELHDRLPPAWRTGDEAAADPSPSWRDEEQGVLPSALAPADPRVEDALPTPEPDGVEAWIDVLREGQPERCREARARLVEIGDAAIPALEAAAAEGDPDLTIDARETLRRIRGR